MTEIISSLANPLVKLARSLHQKKSRDETGLFFVEGILHVGEAVSAGWDFDALIYATERLKSDFAHQLVEMLIARGVRCVRVTAEVFESIAEKDNPQGLAAIIRQRSLRLDALSKSKFLVAAVSPQDPGNVGTILRTVDAVGADGLLLLDGGADPYHPSVVRASMGSLFWKPFVSSRFADFYTWSQSNKFRIIGTSAHATLDYRKAALDERPTILMFGSEQKGLTPEQIGVCDDLISLPMRGRATSLNLSVAAGVLMYMLKKD